MEPNLSIGFLEWVKSKDFSNSTILEIGSGESTFFFTKKFKQVYSYESNIDYFNSLKIQTNNIDNVSLSLFNKNIFNNLEFKEKVIQSDVILIDNDPWFIPRHEFAYFIDLYKKKETLIILDNGDWNLEAYEFLRKKYYCHDFLRREENLLTQTTIFFYPRERV
jgi:hypothetical protein